MQRTWTRLRVVLFLAVGITAQAVAAQSNSPGHAPGSGSGDGTNAFTGLSQAPEANLFVGSGTTSIAIELPPGRKNLTPKIALSYNTSGGPSPYGYGWDLPLGRIQRSRKYGVNPDPSRDPFSEALYTKQFVITVPSGTVECELLANNTCEVRTDEAFWLIQVDQNANQWLVRDRAGMLYLFGADAESRIGWGEPFESTMGWGLSRIFDADGSTIVVEYDNPDGDVLYPKKVTYGGWTGHDASLTGASGVYEVSFTWRTDLPVAAKIMNALATMSPATITRMLWKVTVKHKSSGAMIREYRLRYDFDGLIRRQGRQGFLTGVVLYGKGNTPLSRADGQVAATTFVYQEHRSDAATETFGFGDGQELLQLQGIDNNWGRDADGSDPTDTERELLDMNGDSFVDLVDTDECNDGSSHQWRVYLGSRNGFAPSSVAWRLPGGVNCDMRRVESEGSQRATIFDTFDLSGDGVPDFVDATDAETTGKWKVYKGAVNPQTSGDYGQFESSAWLINAPYKWLKRTDIDNQGKEVNDAVDLVDFNGDGLLDLVDARGDSSGGLPWLVHLHKPRGLGFLSAQPFTDPGEGVLRRFLDRSQYEPAPCSPFNPPTNPPCHWVDRQIMFTGTFDMNGDGLLDQVISDENDDIRVRFNVGRELGQNANWGSSVTCGRRGLMQSDDEYVVRDIFDINGDRLPDLVTACEGESDNWLVRLNQGNGFSIVELSWKTPKGFIRRTDDDKKTRQDVLDLDGDGMVDFIDFDADDANFVVYRNAGGAWVPASSSAPETNPVGGLPDMLVASENGIGGIDTLTYKPSNAWLHTDEDGIPRMPFSLWVLHRVNRFNGHCADPANCSPALFREISYGYGSFEMETREFRGFRTVKTEASGEPTRYTFFFQDHHRRGKVDSTEEKQGQQLLRSTKNTYECVEKSGVLGEVCREADQHANRWVRLKKSETFDYDVGTGSGSKTSWNENLSFDAWGNVTQSAAGGSVGPRVDTYITYGVVNTTTPFLVRNGWWVGEKYLLDKPTRVQVIGKHPDSGEPDTILEQKWFHYNGARRHQVELVQSWLYDAEGVVADAPAGDACIIEPLPGHGTCVSVRTEYDTWGNITAVTDAKGQRTETVFDTNTKMFPMRVKTFPAAGQGGTASEVAMWYDEPCGKVVQRTPPYLLGQSPTEQPQFVSIHDAFCREIGYGEPSAQSPWSTVGIRTIGYYLGASGHPTTIATTEQVAPGNWSSRWDLSDALGRPLQSQVDAVVDDIHTTVAASSVQYDNNGRPYRQYVAARITPTAWPDYSSGGRELAALPAGTGYTETEFDTLGRATKVTQPDGTYSTADYTVAWQTTSRDACFHSPSCDGSQVIEKRDFGGRVIEKQIFKESIFETGTRYTYDGASRLLRSVQLTAPETESNNTKIEMTYDTLGRKLRTVDPDSGTWRYAYDRMGNLVYQDDPKGVASGETAQSIQFRYDGLGRVTRKSYVGSDSYCTIGDSGCTETDWVSYGYDRDPTSIGCTETGMSQYSSHLGKLTDTEEMAGTTTTGCYDVLGRQVWSQRTLRAGVEEITATTTMVHDFMGKVLATTYPDGEVVQYRYNAAGKLIAVESVMDGVSRVYVYDIRYDVFGKPISVWHENGVTDWFEFHDKTKNFRLGRIQTKVGEAQPLLDLSYPDYQANGLLKRVVDADTSARRNSAEYAYDGLGRLTSVTNSLFNGDYAHGGNLGNMTSKDGTNLTYGEAAHPHRVTQASGGAAPYGAIDYDGNGNQLGSTGRTYTYTQDDRLKTVTANGATVSFFYDQAGARFAKRTQVGTGAPGLTWYVGDIMEVSPGYVTKYYFANGVRIASQRYTRPPGFLAMAEPWVQVAATSLGGLPVFVLQINKGQNWILGFLGVTTIGFLLLPGRRKAVVGIAVRRGHVLMVILAFSFASLPFPLVVRPAQAGGTGQTDDTKGIRHYHYDHLGSVQVMTNEQGAVFRHIRYNTYGRVRGTWAANGSNASSCATTGYCIGFTGYDQEPFSQILYARARFYDPGLGMFLTHDPARQFANPYSYVGWNPVNAVDPSGKIAWWVVALIAVAIGATASGIQAAVNGASTGQAFKAAAIGGAIAGASAVVGMGALSLSASYLGPTATYAMGAAMVGSGVYSTVQSFRSGQYVVGSVGAVLTALGAYGLTQGPEGFTQRVEEIEWGGSAAERTNNATSRVQRVSFTDSVKGRSAPLEKFPPRPLTKGTNVALEYGVSEPSGGPNLPVKGTAYAVDADANRGVYSALVEVNSFPGSVYDTSLVRTTISIPGRNIALGLTDLSFLGASASVGVLSAGAGVGSANGNYFAFEHFMGAGVSLGSPGGYSSSYHLRLTNAYPSI